MAYEQNGVNENHAQYHRDDEIDPQDQFSSSLQKLDYKQPSLHAAPLSANASTRVSASDLEVSNIAVKDMFDRKKNNTGFLSKKRNIMPATQFTLEH